MLLPVAHEICADDPAALMKVKLLTVQKRWLYPPPSVSNTPEYASIAKLVSCIEAS